MLGMTKEEGIKQVFEGGGHVVILGAGASIASNNKNPVKSGQILPSMNNYISVLGLDDLIKELPKELHADNFEILYGNLHKYNSDCDEIKEIEQRTKDYFGGMTLPDEPTIYDYLILSLRSKDLIATFNWDPFLYQAWSRISQFTKDLPHISFLHGNVGIGYSPKYKRCGPAGMYVSEFEGYFYPTKLLYPVEQKNYTQDEFLIIEWNRLKGWLSKNSGTVRVTIFGYSAPISDIEAISLLNEAWGMSEQRSMEQFEIIDISSEEELREKWNGFIHSHHYDIVNDYFKSSLAINPRRTSESYYSHYLPMNVSEAFRSSNPIPENFSALSELWEWHKPLIEAEIEHNIEIKKKLVKETIIKRKKRRR